MFVRDYASCEEFIAGDETRLRELFNPLSRITSYNVCYTKLLRDLAKMSEQIGNAINADVKGEG